MSCERVCPFYGRSIDHCDVGAGYISPYHVEVMVRHCTSRYEDCAKYKELIERALHERGEKTAQTADIDAPAAYVPSGGLVLPLQLDREVVTLVNHQIRTPLTSIRSFTEILLGYPIDDPDARRRFLQIIHEETERLSHAVDVLFGKASAGAPAHPSSDAPQLTSSPTQVETREPKEAMSWLNH